MDVSPSGLIIGDRRTDGTRHSSIITIHVREARRTYSSLSAYLPRFPAPHSPGQQNSKWPHRVPPPCENFPVLYAVLIPPFLPICHVSPPLTPPGKQDSQSLHRVRLPCKDSAASLCPHQTTAITYTGLFMRRTTGNVWQTSGAMI